MLRIAAGAGTSHIVATPHANPHYSYDRHAAQALLDELQAAAGSAIRLHLGCDCHFSLENIEAVLADPAGFTVNGGPWLLIEFADFNIPPSTEEIFEKLHAAGLRLIVTHPERNAVLRQSLQRLRAWVDSGVCMQVTAQSLTGGFGRAARGFAFKLIRGGLVHFVASDGHDPVDRPPRLDEAFRLLCSRFGEPYARLLVEQFPRAVIEARPLDRGPAPRPPVRRWYQFWR